MAVKPPTIISNSDPALSGQNSSGFSKTSKKTIVSSDDPASLINSGGASTAGKSSTRITVPSDDPSIQTTKNLSAFGKPISKPIISDVGSAPAETIVSLEDTASLQTTLQQSSLTQSKSYSSRTTVTDNGLLLNSGSNLFTVHHEANTVINVNDGADPGTTQSVIIDVTGEKSLVIAGITTTESSTAVLDSVTVYNTDKNIYVTGIDQGTTQQFVTNSDLVPATTSRLGGVIIDGVTIKVTANGVISTVESASGFSGTSGYSGTSGQEGPIGFSGLSGTSGTSGASGVGGEVGSSGVSGKSGYSGYSGASGFSGFSGKAADAIISPTPPPALVGQLWWNSEDGSLKIYYQDPDGIQWVDAFPTRNISGFSGFSGFSGISGISGFSSFSGFSGISGFSSFSGFSGISGFSSFSGISGFSGSPGGQVNNIVTISNNYTMTSANEMIINISNSPVTVTLPDVNTVKSYYFKNSANGFMTLQTINNQIIEDDTSLVLQFRHSGCRLLSTGTRFYIF